MHIAKHDMGETGLKSESWKVQNHIQNAPQHCTECHLSNTSTLKSGHRWKSHVSGMIQMPKTETKNSTLELF